MVFMEEDVYELTENDCKEGGKTTTRLTQLPLLFLVPCIFLLRVETHNGRGSTAREGEASTTSVCIL